MRLPPRKARASGCRPDARRATICAGRRVHRPAWPRDRSHRDRPKSRINSRRSPFRRHRPARLPSATTARRTWPVSSAPSAARPSPGLSGGVPIGTDGNGEHASKEPSLRSRRGLDGINFLMADVRDGVGPYPVGVPQGLAALGSGRDRTRDGGVLDRRGDLSDTGRIAGGRNTGQALADRRVRADGGGWAAC